MKILRILFCYLIVVFLILPLSLFSQLQRGGEIQYDVDFARFRASKGFTFIELYFSIPREKLDHSIESTGYAAKYEISVDVLQADSIISSKKWQQLDKVDSLAEIKAGQRLYDLHAMFMKEGNYKIKTKINDLSNNTESWSDYNLQIGKFETEKLDLSDLQLGMNIIPDRTQGRFNKNGYRVIPNPRGIYGSGLPSLYYYSEIYNLAPLKENSDSTYTVKLHVRDQQGTLVLNNPAKRRVRKGASLVELGNINVDSLLSGSYQLQIYIIDGAKEDTVSKSKNFYVYRPGDFTSSEQVALREKDSFLEEYDLKSESEIDEEFNIAEYIATKQEKKVYKDLDLTGKRQFIATFWRNRDPNPATEINESKQEYFRRREVANARFKSGNEEGWRKDRGRVYMVYGEPDDIEYASGGISQKTHQIWHYFSIEGGIDFVFVDTRGFGDLRLVHSTSLNEIQDYDWQVRYLSR